MRWLSSTIYWVCGRILDWLTRREWLELFTHETDTHLFDYHGTYSQKTHFHYDKDVRPQVLCVQIHHRNTHSCDSINTPRLLKHPMVIVFQSSLRS